jgi:cell division protein FtsI (penicillin-binding protein 3)
MLTIAAALEEKVTSPNEVFDCQMGKIFLGGRTIHDWKAYGLLSVSEILQKSSDVGAMKIALRLGDDRMYKYIRAFGFGSQTGIELPAETRGITKPVSRWSKMSIGAISMGQEIGVSPLQLVSMTSAMANDGVWTPARIFAGTTVGSVDVVGGPARSVVFHPGQQRRVISSMTAAQMREMLQEVVLKGTGHKAILDGYSSAGKTGTAQKINPLTHRYGSKDIASFSGFAPVNNPAVTITLVLDSPIGAHHGGDVAAPVWGRIAQQVLEYLDVPHDVDVRNPQRMLLRASVKPEYSSEGSPDHVGEEIAANDVEVTDATSGPPNQTRLAVANGVVPVELHVPSSVETQSDGADVSSRADTRSVGAQADSPLPASGTVVLDIDTGKTVPSFLGKPVRAVIEESEKAGLEVDIFGSGVARQQNPPPGSRLPLGGHVTVQFAR